MKYQKQYNIFDTEHAQEKYFIYLNESKMNSFFGGEMLKDLVSMAMVKTVKMREKN